MLTPKLAVCLREGYSKKIFAQDCIAGVTVGIIAIPLAMAFAIASGVSPDRGLFTAIVAGFFISVFGGSRVQIGGPTGAFVVILYGIVQKHGYEGLAIATFMAGIILILMGLVRLGGAIKFIPYPVITGFTSGIAVIIFSSQVKEFFGMDIPSLPSEFLAKWHSYLLHITTLNPYTTLIGGISLVTLIGLRRFAPRLPAPLAVILGAGIASYLLHLPVETIGSRFGEMPHALPSMHLPQLSLEKIRLLLPDAFTIALLGAIEALLSAAVADGMTGHRHKSNTELLAQGIANVFSVLFGGIAATGAIARTATNIKSGAKTPVAGIIHALTVLVCLWWFAPYARYIPLSALAAILVIVAWNMSEMHHFLRLLSAPRADAATLLLTFLLTVLADLTTAVAVGTVFSTLLFIQNLSNLTYINIAGEEEEALDQSAIPPHIAVFEMSGPFFFGSADRLRSAFSRIQGNPKFLILRMQGVPVMDATGLYALELFFADCKRSGITLYFSDVPTAIFSTLEGAKIGLIHPTLQDALTFIKGQDST
jgi:sulfate permease, SulP family